MRKNEKQNEFTAYGKAMGSVIDALDALYDGGVLDASLNRELLAVYDKLADKQDAIDAYRNYEDYED